MKVFHVTIRFSFSLFICDRMQKILIYPKRLSFSCNENEKRDQSVQLLLSELITGLTNVMAHAIHMYTERICGAMVLCTRAALERHTLAVSMAMGFWQMPFVSGLDECIQPSLCDRHCCICDSRYFNLWFPRSFPGLGVLIKRLIAKKAAGCRSPQPQSL